MDEAYEDFIASKAPRALAVGIDAGAMCPSLFDYQQNVTAFCLRMGRAGLFLDTGLGKTICELEFAAQAMRAVNAPALILTRGKLNARRTACKHLRDQAQDGGDLFG